MLPYAGRIPRFTRCSTHSDAREVQGTTKNAVTRNATAVRLAVLCGPRAPTSRVSAKATGSTPCCRRNLPCSANRCSNGSFTGNTSNDDSRPSISVRTNRCENMPRRRISPRLRQALTSSASIRAARCTASPKRSPRRFATDCCCDRAKNDGPAT